MNGCCLSPFLAVEHPGCPLRLEEENGLSEGKSEFLSFSPEMAAEQFTLMDAVSPARSPAVLGDPRFRGASFLGTDP